MDYRIPASDARVYKSEVGFLDKLEKFTQMPRPSLLFLQQSEKVRNFASIFNLIRLCVVSVSFQNGEQNRNLLRALLGSADDCPMSSVNNLVQFDSPNSEN